jgi:hypothetical protein
MTVDLSGYPAAPFLMVSKALDLACDPLQCQTWRDYIPFFKEQLSYKVGDVRTIIPPMLTYSDFLGNRESNLSLLKEYLFQTPSTALADLTTPTAVMVLVILIVLFRSLKSILLPFFSSLGRRAGRVTHGPDWEASNEIRIVKFGEYVFRLGFHCCISVVGICYSWDKKWWKNTTLLWQNLPFHSVDPGMTWYYLVQSAYNLEALISLLELSLVVTFSNPLKRFPISIHWSKTVRGDFREMAVHHVVTNLLIIGSSAFRMTSYGSMVFLVHDITDVPVDSSKLANFLKWKRTTTVCFTLMCVTWLVFRLGVLPFVIYRSLLFESHIMLEEGYIDPLYYLTYRYPFYYLIAQIILLHVAWFVMFLRMGYLLASRGEAHDLSEYKKGETQLNGVNSMEHNGMTNGGTANGKKNETNGTTNGGTTIGKKKN